MTIDKNRFEQELIFYLEKIMIELDKKEIKMCVKLCNIINVIRFNFLSIIFITLLPYL